MIRIEIKSTDVQHRTGTSKRTGNPYELFEQRGWLHGAKDYPTEVSFILDKGQTAFAPGFYFVGPEACQIDRFGAVTLNLAKMRPIPRSADKAA
jgi:hypothetical protein